VDQKSQDVAIEALDRYFAVLADSLVNSVADAEASAIRLARAPADAAESIAGPSGSVAEDDWPAFVAVWTSSSSEFWKGIAKQKDLNSSTIEQKLKSYSENKKSLEDKSFRTFASGNAVTKDDLRNALKVGARETSSANIFSQIGIGIPPLMDVLDVSPYDIE
jgi:hypothetical protein